MSSDYLRPSVVLQGLRPLWQPLFHDGSDKIEDRNRPFWIAGENGNLAPIPTQPLAAVKVRIKVNREFALLARGECLLPTRIIFVHLKKGAPASGHLKGGSNAHSRELHVSECERRVPLVADRYIVAHFSAEPLNPPKIIRL